MKRIILSLVLLAALMGCTTRTDYGDCIGVADDKRPELIYKVSVLNVVLGIAFIETIVVPVFVVIDQTFCPVGKK